jgi:hypothetical protein
MKIQAIKAIVIFKNQTPFFHQFKIINYKYHNKKRIIKPKE